jgi:KipI family sensor histidine kinase inhibitor
MNDWIWNVQPMGDAAILITLTKTIDLIANRKIHGLTHKLEVNLLAGVSEIVPAYGSILVHYDPMIVDFTTLSSWIHLYCDDNAGMNLPSGRMVEIPVRYGHVGGPDLDEVANYCRLSPAEVIRIHSRNIYQVFMMGFTPGFPYLGGMDLSIVTPRRDTPRKLVPAGSVGIAGSQTGIYSVDSPGGWRIIGHTQVRLFDLQADLPFLLRPGDRVRFIPISEDGGHDEPEDR